MDFDIWQLTFFFSVLVILYVYAGYPLLLLAINSIGFQKSVQAKDITPSVTLIISAFNEEGVIEDKLRNTLQLDYPADQLEILVASDCSSDRTDDIVQSFAGKQVRLIRLPERGGKVKGLNLAVPEAVGEIIVFSDANAMYDPQAIRKLIRNFADPAIGAVTGEQRYRISTDDPSTQNEDTYWTYELWLKRLESRLGSLVGGDGAIYAIRNGLYSELEPADVSDFINPLQIVAMGYRNVYEPEAFCYEGGATGYTAEFHRKVRIVNGAWAAILKVPGLLNPLRYGFFAIQFLSHKILRWLVAVWMILAIVTNMLIASDSWFYALCLAGQCAFYGAAFVGLIRRASSRSDVRIFSIPYYFCVVNAASLVGILQAIFGRRYATWNVSRAEG